jgi:hypothetical protein
MSATEELFAAVRARATGTPYVVEKTATGFDVRLELEDPQWFGQLREWRLTKASIHHVQVEEASRTIMITDELRTLTWQAGTDGRERPTLGGLTQESEAGFDSSVGRDLVVDTAKPLGWKLRRSLNERIGLYVGVTTIVLLVLAGIGVGVFALAGGLS